MSDRSDISVARGSRWMAFSRAPLLRAVVWAAAGFLLGAEVTAALVSDTLLSQDAVIAGYALALLGWILGIGGWEAFVVPWFGGEYRVDEGTGRSRYFRFNTDHKVVGIQYLVTALATLLIAGSIAMLMRIELMKPGLNVFSGPGGYNQAVSLHGTLMIFGVAAVGIVGGFGNYVVPIMIGAEDMAYPRLNAVSYWFVPMGVLAFLAAPFLGGWESGWTAYPPLSVTDGTGQVLAVLGVLTLGISSVASGINLLATVYHLRAPGLDWRQLPVFVWSMVVTSVLNVAFVPFVGTALVLVAMDRVAGTHFFTKDGLPLLYQDLFWIFGHPEVYILILPGFGIVLELLPVFARKTLFGYKWVVGGFLAVMLMSMTVWDHHMYTTGISNARLVPFMTTTEMISVPTGFVYLAALGTLWGGRIRLTTPMLFCLGFLFNFLIGGLTGVFLADVALDFQMQDTFFVVAHFHYTIMGGMVFALIAGIYYWFPKMSGRMYHEGLGRLHFWWMFIAYNATFLPMFWAGVEGMNRRVADYLPYLQPINEWVSAAAFVLGASFVLPAVHLTYAWVRGEEASSNPWRSRTLEWTIPSPPPKENFHEPPRIVDFYDYDGAEDLEWPAPSHPAPGVPVAGND
ncbi:MAG: cbb3-type cytochrome c oxidase subunit I [Firmicutes bacterium]|nr:cbb3-type cytochrome c oxidase subunit I [Bacillota bacterium]